MVQTRGNRWRICIVTFLGGVSWPGRRAEQVAQICNRLRPKRRTGGPPVLGEGELGRGENCPRLPDRRAAYPTLAWRASKQSSPLSKYLLYWRDSNAGRACFHLVGRGSAFDPGSDQVAAGTQSAV